MQIKTIQANLAHYKTECLIIGVDKANALQGSAKQIDDLTQGSLKRWFQTEGFEAQIGEVLVLRGLPKISALRVICVGLNSERPVGIAAYRRAIIAAIQETKKLKIKQLTIACDDVSVKELSLPQRLQQWVTSLAQCHYRFTRFKTKKQKEIQMPRCEFLLQKAPSTAVKQSLRIAEILADAQQQCRFWGDMPANHCTPRWLADEASKLARRTPNLRAEILDEKKIKKLGMGLLQCVAQGSKEPPRLVVLHYQQGSKSEKPIVIIGKGITFDTGGISLKPSANMDEMKFDMCGAASILATLYAIAKLKLKINVIGIMALAENFPAERATKPGDIIRSLSGQTVEILNTDAEGRLVLADALSYAQRFKPEIVVDVATLTALMDRISGTEASALYTKDDALAEELLAAGLRSHDRLWRMPFWDEGASLLDSNFADMANIPSKPNAMAAPLFLERFTPNTRFAHIDIGSVVYLTGSEKGATGRPVPLLLEWLLTKAGRS
jgi:leucyl aminopeptidase